MYTGLLMKEQLQKIIDDTNPKGLFRCIKFKHLQLFNKIDKIQRDNNLKTFNEAIYWILNDLNIRPVCPGYSDKCISKLRFVTLKEGYSSSCFKCCMKDPQIVAKQQATLQKKYGVTNISQRSETIEKRKRTSIERYGVESTNQIPEVIAKKKATLKEHYGDVGLGHTTINEKKKKTNLKKYGTNWATQTEETQDKRKETCLNKYGVDNVMHVDSINARNLKTWNAHHLSDQIDIVKKKIQSRNLKLIGDYQNVISPIMVQCMKCNKQYQTKWDVIRNGGGKCPNC